jgi:hypothetical protein
MIIKTTDVKYAIQTTKTFYQSAAEQPRFFSYYFNTQAPYIIIHYVDSSLNLVILRQYYKANVVHQKTACLKLKTR